MTLENLTLENLTLIFYKYKKSSFYFYFISTMPYWHTKSPNLQNGLPTPHQQQYTQKYINEDDDDCDTDTEENQDQRLWHDLEIRLSKKDTTLCKYFQHAKKQKTSNVSWTHVVHK